MKKGASGMRRFVMVLLVLQLLILPSAGYAQGGEVVAAQPAKSLNADVSVEKGPKQSAKKEANYEDPSSYPLIGKGELIASLVDSYSTYQTIYYEDTTTSPYDSSDMKIQLSYSSEYAYYKDRMVIIEFFKENGNTLDYDGYAEFDTYGDDDVYLNSYVAKSDYAHQPYIYMRVGVTDSVDDPYYSDVTTFKVANPFYTGSGGSDADVAYAVISNESTDGNSEQPTGTFNFNSMKKSLDKSSRPGKYKIDVNKPFNIEGNKEKRLRKNTKLIQKSYSLGDSKYFWVTNLETDLDYQISARLAYSETKANVWVHNNQILDTDAAKLGKEFDNHIYSSVTNNFGFPSDVDADGKINIVTYDIQDGFSESGGYVAGYFWAGDLYNVPHSNKSEIFYIDTYPTMSSGSTRDVTKAYDTLAHEFQHMVNFNQNVLIEGSNEMDTWLNEGLSMAAEQIYTGAGLQDRIDYYNSSSSIANGHSLLYWDNDGDLLSNYSLSYLFVQYVKKQVNQGDPIFKEILTDRDNNYKAIENVAKKYISREMTFGKLMTNFRIALLLKEATGLYGFNGDRFFDSLQKKIFTGKSTDLRGGGAIVTTYNPAEGLPGPADKGQDVTYTRLTENIDRTPPDVPVVNGLSDADHQVTGTAEAKAMITVTIGSFKYTATADSKGNFKVVIPQQKAGTKISVTASDGKNVSEPAIVVVQDKTAPSFTVNVVSNKSKEVTGKTEAGAAITVTIGSKKYTGKADTKGYFKIGIPVQKAGTKIVVTAKDQAGNTSPLKTMTVLDKIAPSTPTVYTVSNKTKVLTGKTEAKAVVTVTIAKKKYTTRADSKGYFKVTIPVQKAGARLAVTAKDGAGNVSAVKSVTVVDKIAPSAPKVLTTVKRTTKVVTGTAEANSTITIKVGRKVIGTAKANSKHKFSVKIKPQKKKTVLSITATDKAKNVSKATIIKVK